MNTDVVVPVAYAMHASPKRYALLLGAGISVAAGLPTASDVSGNMILAVASGRGEQVERGKENEVCLAWYKDKFGEPATFQRLMNNLGISEENRRDGLKKFIYQTDEDGNIVSGAPTEAHRVIARLVKSGVISLIITTNFDTLMEEALKRENVPYEVITEETSVTQMSVFPDRCRILKVNGDFERGTLRITPEDLKGYPMVIEDYLKRIFREYGLVICGWSGGYDTHLSEILCAPEIPRQYPVFWGLRNGASVPPGVCKALMPNGIDINNADDFFTTLELMIKRFSKFEPRTTLSAAAAVKKAKDALMGQNPEMVVPDVINAEVEIVLAEIEREHYIYPGTVEAQAVYYRRLAEIEGVAIPLAAMLATLAYYDRNEDYAPLIADTIERLVNPKRIKPFMPGSPDDYIIIPSHRDIETGLQKLRYYPALLTVYATGIAAVKEQRVSMLDAAIFKPQVFGYSGEYEQKIKFFEQVNIWYILECDHHWIIELSRDTFNKGENFYTYPLLTIQSILKPLIPNEKRYVEYFDIFEYLYCLSFLDSWGDNSEPSNAPRYLQNLRLKFVLESCGYRIVGSPTIPFHIVEYLTGMAERIMGTTFFNGKEYRLDEANKKFAEIFKISPQIQE